MKRLKTQDGTPIVWHRLSRNRFIGLTSAAIATGLVASTRRSCAGDLSFDPRLATYSIELYDGKYTGQSSSQQWTTVLNQFERSWVADPRKKLALHFHGGLVDGQSGKEGASALIQPYLNTGAYPIFVIWHSGPEEAFPPVVFNQGGPIASPHGMFNRGGVLAARIRERDADGTCHPGADAIEERLRFLNIASGPSAWAFMKEEIDHSFASGNAFDVFLRWLSDFSLRNGAVPHIVLIGHSAGAIYVCRFIQEFDRMMRASFNAPASLLDAKFGVIFMAAAVRFDLFNETLELGRVSDFRLFTMADFLERNDEVARDVVLSKVSNDFQLASQITAAYPHSLLYLISGVLEDAPDTPLVGMERFWHNPGFTGNPLVTATKNHLNAMYASECHYLVLSKTAANSPVGYKSDATTHGAFDWADPKTLESVTHILEANFRDGGSSRNVEFPISSC